MYPEPESRKEYYQETTAGTVKESPATRELNILSKEIGEITALSEELLRRLSPVLSMQPEVEGAEKEVPEESLAEIPSQIRRSRKNLLQPRYTIQNILNRLEI